jgi:multidrug transporter EmrE-like cation transporter
MRTGAVSLLLWSVALALTLTSSHILLRSSATLSQLSPAWLWRVGLAACIYFVVFLIYGWLIRTFEMSALYPLYTALSLVGVFLAGILFFGESLTPFKGIGLSLLLLGIAFFSHG